jgi:hypothetical protein
MALNSVNCVTAKLALNMMHMGSTLILPQDTDKTKVGVTVGEQRVYETSERSERAETRSCG